MLSLIQSIKRYRLWAMLLVLVFIAIKACQWFPESTFTLANDSRLPKWVTLPSGLTRANTSLTMSYYSLPWSFAQFILRDKDGRILMKENGRMGCELTSPSQGDPSGYPAYEPITVNGKTEIIEHRKMEPIFYVTDDAAVWKQYAASGCR